MAEEEEDAATKLASEMAQKRKNSAGSGRRGRPSRQRSQQQQDEEAAEEELYATEATQAEQQPERVENSEQARQDDKSVQAKWSEQSAVILPHSMQQPDDSAAHADNGITDERSTISAQTLREQEDAGAAESSDHREQRQSSPHPSALIEIVSFVAPFRVEAAPL